MNDKSGKSKKRRKKSAGREIPIEPEAKYSAFALMQMREDREDGGLAYYEGNHAASAALIAENPPMRPSTDPCVVGTEPVRKSNSRKTSEKMGMNKRVQIGNHNSTGSEHHSDEAKQYPDFPSTPPGQIERSSPSPYRPTIPSANALDDIPTDDDDVAAYEEYAKETTASADSPGIPDHDIFNFSQQPPNPFDQDEIGEDMHTACQLSTDVYALPQDAGKQKRKKRKRRTDDGRDNKQQRLAHVQGQKTPHCTFEAFDDFFEINMSSADLYHKYEEDNMPIDPELHSINDLPPSADLSNLNDEDLIISQKTRRNPGRHGSSQPRKRRRLEELQGANTTDLPYMSPYAFQHDQENIEDQSLAGFEDVERQISPELGSPCLNNAADRDADFSGDGAEPMESARYMEKGETKKARSKKERVGTKNGDEKRPTTDKSENGGPFSAAEGLRLDAFRENYCEANDMTVRKFNDLIQTQMRGNAQVTALFSEIHENLSYRPRISVHKFCRRRFHNYARGPWSAEEDEMLKHGVAEKGRAWKGIGDSLGRMPEDCRDRYRNYLVNADHRNREQWTETEVINLCTAILECMQLMKEDRMRTREKGEDVPESGTESDQEVEDMKHINWQSVSDRMGEHGGGRSRLQCSFKWGQLKKREQADYLKATRESRNIEKRKSTPPKNPWRMKLAYKKIANMKPGDKHAFLQAVLDTHVPEEGNIPWKSLGDDEFRARWTSTDKKAAWSRLKGEVPGYESMDYRSVAKDLLSQTMNTSADVLDERWDPKLHGDVSANRFKKKRKSSKKQDKGKERDRNHLPNRCEQMSNEFVYSGDDMDGDDDDQTRLGAFEPQDHNAYNVLPSADGLDGGLNESTRAVPSSADGQDDIFNDQRIANRHLPIANGEVSPELAGRLQSALNAYA